jgi:hypothetical protein
MESKILYFLMLDRACFVAEETELSEEKLIKQANKMLSAKEFQKKLRSSGYKIECCFLDSTKDKTYEIASKR